MSKRGKNKAKLERYKTKPLPEKIFKEEKKEKLSDILKNYVNGNYKPITASGPNSPECLWRR